MEKPGIHVENAIARQIADVDKRIRSLTEEKHALERLLLKTRHDNVLGREVTRKNSVSRILVENQILRDLRNSKKPLSNRDLYISVVSVLMSVNESTFRSYLKRMKDANLIQNRGNGWVIVE